MATTYAIPDGRVAFDVIKTTATVSTGATVSGLSFSPGLLWRKNRDNVESHYLVDSVRGTSTGGYLSSNSTAAAAGYPGGDGTLTFNSDGYTITETNWNAGEFYFNGRSYVDWLWKAGGTPASNTSGSITSSVSANTTAGFSVVTYTGNGTAGATIGHGLGVAPSMVIAKNRSTGGTSAYEWTVYHVSLGATKAVFLNDTGAAATDAGYWYNTAPTSSVITVPSNTRTNVNGSNFVFYCFAPVSGYSAFGSYTGNGSTDGPFVYLGFKPRFVMLKASSTTGDWIVYDSSRNAYNVADLYLYPNSSAAEAGSGTPRIDFLSNGFKLRNTGQGNVSAVTFIYACFAENPTKFANAR